MALDYSKLTDEELDAIARDDYSKLSDKTLRAISSDSAAKKPAPKTETAAQTFGRSAASLADTALNAITGTLDVAAYPFARAYYGTVGGLSPEAAAARATAETTSPKDVVGRAFGVTGTAGYEQAPLRQLGTWAGQTVGENVIQPTAQTFNIPEQDVGNMLNSLAMGAAPVAGRVTAPITRRVGNAVYAVDQAVVNPVQTAKTVGQTVAGVPDFVQGAYRGAFNTTAKPTVNPADLKPWETSSARMPVGENYIPADVLEQYRAGQITSEQAQALARPITELPQQALAKTQGMVPYEGQVAKAAGEQFGAGYRDPYKLGAEVAADYFLGGIPTIGRLGLKAYDAAQLVKAYNELGKAGFSPLTPDEFKALNPKTDGGVSGPVAPTQPRGPAPTEFVGPVQPKQPRTQQSAGPSQPFVMPTAEETYTNAVSARPSHQQYEAFTDAVQQRTADIMKQARQEGRTLTKEAAENIAEDQIRAARRALQNQQTPAAGPTLAQEGENPALVKTRGEGTLDKPNAAWDREDWLALQQKAASGQPLTAADLNKANTITNRYGPDPFGSGDLTGKKLFNTVGQGEASALPTDPIAAAEEVVKRKYTRQEDTIKELQAQLTPEQLAAQEAEVERQLAKSRGKPAAGKNTPTDKVSTESLKAKMSTPEQTAMDEATRARLEQLGLTGKKKGTPPPGTSQLITQPSNFSKMMTTPADDFETMMKNKQWSSREDFAQETMMRDLGLNSDKNFVAAMDTPEGKVVRAENPEKNYKLNGYQFADDNTTMVHEQFKQTGKEKFTITDNEYQYVFDVDATGNIENLMIFELRGNERSMLADFDGTWSIRHNDGNGFSWRKETDLKKSSAEAKELNNIKKFDWIQYVNDFIDKADNLTKGNFD